MADDPSADPTGALMRQLLGGGSMIGPKDQGSAPPGGHGAVQNMSIPPQGRALLATIGSPGFESNGGYTQRFNQEDFSSFADHPRTTGRITSGPYRGNVSDAAGRYQLISTTYDAQKQKLGLKDFSPASQDAAAWGLANDAYTQGTKGRDLQTDLQNPAMLPRIAQALHSQWTSLPGGIENRSGMAQFQQAFSSNLQSEMAREPAQTGGAPPMQMAPAGGRSPASADELRDQMQMQALGII